MAGVSDKAVKTNYTENKYRYNGKELQHQEFSDGSGLEDYDFGARMLDPQIGRWHVIDPMASKYDGYSPYGYVNNSPILFNDPTGKEIWINYGDNQRAQYKNGSLYDQQGKRIANKNIKDKFLLSVVDNLNKMNKNENGNLLLSDLSKSGNKFNFTNTNATQNGHKVNAMMFSADNVNGGGEIHAAELLNGTIQEGQAVEAIAHELFHGYQSEHGEGGASAFSEVEAMLFATNLASSLGYGTDAWTNGTRNGEIFEKAMDALFYNTKKWGPSALPNLQTAVQTFKTGSGANSTHLYDNFPLIKTNQNINHPLIAKFFPLMH